PGQAERVTGERDGGAQERYPLAPVVGDPGDGLEPADLAGIKRAVRLRPRVRLRGGAGPASPASTSRAGHVGVTVTDRRVPVWSMCRTDLRRIARRRGVRTST